MGAKVGREVAENEMTTRQSKKHADFLLCLLPNPLPTHTSQPNPAHTITGKGIFRTRRAPSISSSHGQSVRSEGREACDEEEDDEFSSDGEPLPPGL